MDRIVLSKIAAAGTCLRLFSLQPLFVVPFKKRVTPIFLIFFFFPLLSLISPQTSLAMETVIPEVYLNEQQKGEYFMKMTEDRDFLIKAEDLETIGLLDPKGKTLEIEGVSYLSMRSITGVTFIFDEKIHALKIQASPEQLASTVLDFATNQRKDVQFSQDNSVFFNYAVNYNATTGFKFDSVSGTGELGIKVGNFLFLSDTVISTKETETKINRLLTSLTYDRRDRMDTFVFGDSYATSGSLGSCLTLGGLSFSKNFAANPNIIKRPVQGYQGYVSTPSEIDVYLNGVKIRTEKIPAGGYNLKNILGYGGRQDMDIVIKDSFGREQRIANPFYVADSLLAKGFHDYSYHLGFQRENIGTEEDRYGDLAFLGYHRYGLTNALTVGLRGEAGSGMLNLGSSVTYGTKYGLFDLALAGSQGKEEKTGYAGSVNYAFQGKRFNARIGATSFTEDYSKFSLIDTSSLKKSKLEFGGGIGFGSKNFGSLALNYSQVTNYNMEERRISSLMYSRGIGQRFSITLSFTHNNSLNQVTENNERTSTSDFEFFVSLTYYPWKETIMSNTGMSGDSFRGNIQLQKNAPVGEGYGYRASIDSRDENNEMTTTIRPYFQYNGKYGVYSAEISSRWGGRESTQTYQFNASGAIIYVGKTFGFSRPIEDSFAIVKVGQVPGVRVYHNNQDIGKTDRLGKIVLPTFHSYDTNQIRINDRDIPLDYALTGVTRNISPSFRSGTLVKFEAKKVQAFTAKLYFIKNGQKLPAEYYRITMRVNGKSTVFQTGRDGEFFIEDAVSGSHKASLKYAGQIYTFDINVPQSNDIIIDAGEIHVQTQP